MTNETSPAATSMTPTEPHPPSGSAESTTREGQWLELAGPYQRTSTLWILFGLLSLVQAADVIMGASVLNLLIEAQAWISWLVAGCIAIAASASAFLVGRDRRMKGKPGISLALWLALGVTMAGMRILEPAMHGFPVEAKHWLTALLIFVLYVVSGHAISEVAYRLSNPKLTQFQTAKRALAKNLKESAVKEALLTRLDYALALAAKERLSREHERDLVIDAATAGAKVLKHRARLLVAELAGSPDTTAVYRQPLWPADEAADRADR